MDGLKKHKTGRWMALVLCAAVLAAGLFEQLVANKPSYAMNFAPGWIPIAAALVAASGIIRFYVRSRWLRIQNLLHWTGIFMMLWTANGLPLDLMRLIPGLMPPGVDWSGLITRALALSATVVLARLALQHDASSSSARMGTWYGYAAFALALPYPVIRTIWAFGGTLGLSQPGAGGVGFTPWLASIPWILAALLSLLLVSTASWKPRRFLVTAGWTATLLVAMVGPAACWTLIIKMVSHDASGPEGMAIWVPILFYFSWLLWAIAACAATRSYQLRSSV